MSGTDAKLVEIVARAIAAEEETPFRNHADSYRLSARRIIAAIEASGRRIAPTDGAPADQPKVRHPKPQGETA